LHLDTFLLLFDDLFLKFYMKKMVSGVVRSLLLGFLISGFIQFQSSSQTLSQTQSSLETSQKIKFQDFFNFPIGPKGVEFSQKVLPLVGKTVVIEGFMVRSDALHKGQFLLTPTPIEINEEDDGPANDLPVHTVLVKLDKKQSELLIAQKDGVIRLEGRLELGRQEESGGQVSWIRLIVSPQAVNVLSAGAQNIQSSASGS